MEPLMKDIKILHLISFSPVSNHFFAYQLKSVCPGDESTAMKVDTKSSRQLKLKDLSVCWVQGIKAGLHFPIFKPVKPL